MILVVLGAGASRGAKFVEDSKLPWQPPLNTDFFTQIQRIFDYKFKKDINSTIKYIYEIFGNNFNLSMEELFTQIEFMRKAFRFIKTESGAKLDMLNKIDELKSHLLQSIFAIMEKSIHDSFKDGNFCEYHKNIVNALSINDAIISFNYDCLIDLTLKQFGGYNWNPDYGYAFPSRNYRRLGFDDWKSSHSHTRPQLKDNTIKLLKPHGSINWHITSPTYYKDGQRRSLGNIKLRKRLWEQHGKAQFTIIPPEWNKDIASEGSIFNRIWTESAKMIKKSKTLIFIGFSFTPTDLHAASLFQIAANNIDRLIIVNPDKEARHRTRKILSKGITNKTRIIQFDKLSDFASSLERIRSCIESREEREESVSFEKGYNVKLSQIPPPQHAQQEQKKAS